LQLDEITNVDIQEGEFSGDAHAEATEAGQSGGVAAQPGESRGTTLSQEFIQKQLFLNCLAYHFIFGQVITVRHYKETTRIYKTLVEIANELQHSPEDGEGYRRHFNSLEPLQILNNIQNSLDNLEFQLENFLCYKEDLQQNTIVVNQHSESLVKYFQLVSKKYLLIENKLRKLTDLNLKDKIDAQLQILSSLPEFISIINSVIKIMKAKITGTTGEIMRQTQNTAHSKDKQGTL